MYKLTTRNGIIFFMTIDEVCLFLEKIGTNSFKDGSYVKISYVEDFEI